MPLMKSGVQPVLGSLSGEPIRIARAVRGLSQRELADACGFTTYRIWAIEHRMHRASPEDLVKIWSVLATG
jgi:transcriptional regulator with XRE-family HTH domain